MNKRFFNQQNLTRRLRLLPVLFAMLLMPLGAWAQTITVAGHSPAEGGAIEGDGITGTVTFTASTNTLTLNDATITGSIVKTANEAGDQLTINLVGTNTVNGQILFQSEDRMYPGDLTFTAFTGSGSLNIASNDENGVIDGVSSVNTGEGLYIATDSPDPQCYNGYYINGTTADDKSVKSLTVSTSVTYPIWVYNTSTTHYTQLTATASTFTTPTANVDENHNGSVSYSDNTLTLTNFLCKTTGNNDFVFFVGKSLQNLTVNLVGESSIHQNGFHYASLQETEEEPTLTFTTSNNGKLTFEGEPSFWGNVTLIYENGLGFYSNVISTDWPRLQIGGTFVRGTTNTVGSYSNVSFDDTTNTLTLGGVTIGSQNSTVTDIDVYIKDLKVEISGDNTVYGRFFGMYEENGIRAGTITFKKKSGAETAELTVSGLGDGNGPVTSFVSSTLGEGLYISGIGDDNKPVSTLSYQGGEYYGLAGNMAKTVTISENAPDTKLWIGETEVTSANAEDVFGDGKVSYNMTYQILSLNGATIEEEIVSNVGTLTINLTGSNSVNSISATGNATALAFTGTSTATLNLSNSDGVIYGFSSVDFGDFNLQSSVPGIHWSETHHILCNYDDDIAEKVTLTKDVVYQLWINGVQVTEANKNGITDEEIQSGESTFNTIEGTVKFTPGTENVLLLKKAQLSVGGDDAGPAIVSGLDNLTIQLDGDGNDIGAARSDVNFSGAYGNYIVKSINSNAVLTFTALREDACLYSTISSSQYAYAPFNGFSNIVYNGNLVLMATNTAWQCLKNLSTPSISPDGSTYYLSQEDDQLDGVKIYYTIDYVNGEDVTTPTLYKDNEGLTISGPCTLTAYAEYVQNGVTKNSSNLKAKYFGPAEDPMRLVYGADPVDFVLAPAIEEGDGIIINGIEANVTYSSTTGKVSSETLGSHGAIVSLGYQDETVKTILLNNYFNMDFDVVPPAPTIGLAEGTYSSTHEAITITKADIANTAISYTWDDITGDNDATWTDYTEDGVVFREGTLSARVGYTPAAGGTTIYSDTVSVVYTVLIDISTCTVTGNDNVTYTGAAQTPTITVTPAVGGEALVLGTDYTVSYKKGETAVESMIDAGDYTIVITAKEGSAYGGTKEVGFTIAQAKLSAVTIAAIDDQTFTGSQITPEVTVTFNEKTVSTDEYNVVYGDNINAGENAGTVTLTSKNKNFVTSTDADATTKKTATFNIVAAAAAITATDQTVTFDGEEQPFTNYTIANGEAVVTYYSSEEARTAKTGGTTNAPTNAAIYYVQVTQGDDNYTSAPANATFTISPKALTEGMVEQDGVSFTYSGYTPEYSVSVKDGEEYLAGDDYDCVIKQGGTEIIPVNAGSYDVVVTGKRNYTGTITKTLTITKAQLTVTPDDKTYNVGDNIELTVSYDGFVDGDDEDVLTTEPTASYGTADVTKPGSYEITASGGVAQNYDFIYETGTLTVNRQLNVSFSASNEWATYYGSENLATPEGLKAYQVTAVDGSTVTIGEIGYIPANTAVLLKNVSNNNTWSNIAASAYTGATSTFASNKLIGTASDVDVSTISGGTVYVLYNNMFKRATGGTIPANRGYLVVEPSVVNVGSGAPELSISIGDENTTAINEHESNELNELSGEWFSIDGVKLNGQPQKPGLYIKNGKKVFINKK